MKFNKGSRRFAAKPFSSNRGPTVPPLRDYNPTRGARRPPFHAEIEAASQMSQDSAEFQAFVRDIVNMPLEMAPSVAAAADELADNFEFLGEHDQRNQYILDLGEKIPAMPITLKTSSTRVYGCMSVVHLHGRMLSGPDARIEFVADSDAHIVRGLIALLEKLFSGQPAREVLAFDIESFMRRIHLDQFISSQRRNGLAGMIKRVRDLAARAEGSQ